MDDEELLREYVEGRSERAFAALVERHLPLVHGAALRVVGEGQAAQDVAQGVFIELARGAGRVRRGQALPGWLYRVAYRRALNAIRGEQRRRRREAEAMKTMSEGEFSERGEKPAAWEDFAPMLEEAMAKLGRVEQDAVVLRFFQGKSLRETGAALAMSEEAARKRVSRGLEKMRGYFAKRGVTASAALLAEAISAKAAAGVGAGLAAKVTEASLAGAGSGAGLGMFLQGGLAWAGGALMAVLLAAPVGWEYHRNAQLRAGLAAVEASGNSSAGAGTTGAAEAGETLSDAAIDAEIQKARVRWEERTPEGTGIFPEWEGFLATVSPGDLPQIMGRVAKLTEPFARGDLQAYTLGEWAKTDAAGAVAYAQKLPGTAREGALGWMVPVLVKQNADMAVAVAQQLTSHNARNQAVMDIIQATTKKDPAAALALIPNIVGNRDQAYDVYKIFAGWAESAPAVAISRAPGLPTAEQRFWADQAIVDNWGKKNIPEALAWAGNLTDEIERQQVMEAIGGAWAGEDPSGAVAWVGQMPEGAAKRRVMTQLLTTWGGTDPASALAYLQTLPAGSVPAGLAGMIMTPWMTKDPVAAAKYLMKAPAGSVPQAVANKVWQAWAASNPSAAAQAALQQTGPLQPPMMTAAMAAWLQTDAAGATAFARQIPAGAAQTAAAPEVLSYLIAKDDLTDAAAWAQSMPAGAMQDSMMGSVLAQRVRDDPADAASWMDGLPAGSPRDSAVNTYVRLMVTQDQPEEAAAWVGEIGNGNTANRDIESIARKWLGEDSAAAEAWLAGTSLPEDRKQKLLQAVTPAAQ